jgi:hypothetical protein
MPALVQRTPSPCSKSSPDVFICHAHEDGDFAELLRIRLEQVGFTVWVDTSKLRAGEDWRTEIDESIRSCSALLVVVTPTARQSEYVTYEWAFAWGVGVKVIPLVLKRAPLHPRLEALQYLDFTNRANRPWSQLFETLERLSNGRSRAEDAVPTGQLHQ